MNTSDDCLKEAFQAVLRGDYARRNRLCDRARVLMEAERKAAAVERVLAVDFYVNAAGVSIPTKKMARTVGVIQ